MAPPLHGETILVSQFTVSQDLLPTLRGPRLSLEPTVPTLALLAITPPILPCIVRKTAPPLRGEAILASPYTAPLEPLPTPRGLKPSLGPMEPSLARQDNLLLTLLCTVVRMAPPLRGKVTLASRSSAPLDLRLLPPGPRLFQGRPLPSIVRLATLLLTLLYFVLRVVLLLHGDATPVNQSPVLRDLPSMPLGPKSLVILMGSSLVRLGTMLLILQCIVLRMAPLLRGEATLVSQSTATPDPRPTPPGPKPSLGRMGPFLAWLAITPPILMCIALKMAPLHRGEATLVKTFRRLINWPCSHFTTTDHKAGLEHHSFPLQSVRRGMRQRSGS